jgi:hypothetical protein
MLLSFCKTCFPFNAPVISVAARLYRFTSKFVDRVQLVKNSYMPKFSADAGNADAQSLMQGEQNTIRSFSSSDCFVASPPSNPAAGSVKRRTPISNALSNDQIGLEACIPRDRALSSDRFHLNYPESGDRQIARDWRSWRQALFSPDHRARSAARSC